MSDLFEAHALELGTLAGDTAAARGAKLGDVVAIVASHASKIDPEHRRAALGVAYPPSGAFLLVTDRPGAARIFEGFAPGRGRDLELEPAYGDMHVLIIDDRAEHRCLNVGPS